MRYEKQFAREVHDRVCTSLWVSYALQKGINETQVIELNRRELEELYSATSTSTSTSISISISSTPINCRAAVKREMINNLYWLAEQGNKSQINELIDLMEAEGIKISAKVRRAIATKLEAPKKEKEDRLLPKWEKGDKPESHEGNAKSKQKWRKNGKEARRLSNR